MQIIFGGCPNFSTFRGNAGKNKVVGKDYVPTKDDKSNIFIGEK